VTSPVCDIINNFGAWKSSGIHPDLETWRNLREKKGEEERKRGENFDLK